MGVDWLVHFSSGAELFSASLRALKKIQEVNFLTGFVVLWLPIFLYQSMGRSKKVQICIVTPDLLGPVRNGGIGTACTSLAEFFASGDHRVTLLFTRFGTSEDLHADWVARYQRQDIEVVFAESLKAHIQRRVFPNHPPLKMAHLVHDWLATRSFDVVFFMEWQGNGFYAMQAKRSGLRFQDTVFITVTHSPSIWHAVNNVDLPADLLTSLTYFMERKSVEWADTLVSPSAYMLVWLKRYGFNLPARSVVLPNLIKLADTKRTRPDNSRVPVKELVFFGRLEYRKGLTQFCDALDRLETLGVAPEKVTFLGKFSRMGHEHSGAYIARRSVKWSFPVNILARMDQAEAIEYLQGAKLLAVMPSVADNSPYTVYECLVAGVPLLARNVGGVGELIDKRDHTACLFDDNPNTLAIRFADVIRNGARVARLGFDLHANRRSWLKLLGELLAERKPKPLRESNNPKVSVCLTHYNRPKLLRQSVDSLLSQDYPNFEVILVDDGSPSKAAQAALDQLEMVFAERGWRIVRLQNGYLGKARNSAVEHANGEFFLFMDDDNVARPNMISRFVQAAVGSGADLVTAVFDVFSSQSMPTTRTPVLERFLPVGDVVSFSLVTNAIGDANALIRRSLFQKLGGFSEDYGIGHEDFELYLRAVLAGASMCVVPEPLFWYRRNGASMLNATHAAANRMRSFRPFLDALSAPFAELAVLAFGCIQGQIAAGLVSEAPTVELDSDDQRRLRFGDPDAPETVVALAKMLIAQGEFNLAEQLLSDLARRGSQADLAGPTAVIRVLKAAKYGDAKALEGALKAFGRSRAARALAAEACDMALRSITSTPSAADLVVQLTHGLSSARPSSIRAKLDAALALAQCDKQEEALGYLAEAIELAGAVYLQTRPDVAEALTRHEFASGLDHYLRHGYAERCPWPELLMFESACKKLRSLIQLNSGFFSSQDRQLLALAINEFGAERITDPTI